MCIVKGDLDDRTIAGAGAAGTLGRSEGVSGRLVGPAAFKAVEVSLTWHLVGSIPIHSRNAPAVESATAIAEAQHRVRHSTPITLPPQSAAGSSTPHIGSDRPSRGP